MLSIGIEMTDSDVEMMKEVFESDDVNEVRSKFKEIGLDLNEKEASTIFSNINSEGEMELPEDALEDINGGVATGVLVAGILISIPINIYATIICIRGIKKSNKMKKEKSENK